jgi:hypothetical protein
MLRSVPCKFAFSIVKRWLSAQYISLAENDTERIHSVKNNIEKLHHLSTNREQSAFEIVKHSYSLINNYSALVLV